MNQGNGMDVNELLANQQEIIQDLISRGLLYQPITDQEGIQPIYGIPGLNPEYSQIQLDAIRAHNSVFVRSERYAEFVRHHGGMREINGYRIASFMREIRDQIDASENDIVDQHTAVSIEETIHEALLTSPTFRQIVSFSLGEERSLLNFQHNVIITEIFYRNHYSVSPNTNREVTYEQIMTSRVGDVPITPNIAMYYDGNTRSGNMYIYHSVSPNYSSPYYPVWQAALIHEIIHAITNSGDPLPGGINLGPTEILTQLVMTEMATTIRSPEAQVVFNSYSSTDRIMITAELELAALVDAFSRVRDQQALLDRLLDISIRLNPQGPFVGYISNPTINIASICPRFNENSSSHFLFPGADAAKIVKSFFCITHDSVIFNDGLNLSDSNLKTYDLFSVASAKDIAEKNGVIDKKEYSSWKDFYSNKYWSEVFVNGNFKCYMEKPKLLMFADGSFAIGISGLQVLAHQINYEYNDKWFNKANTSMSGQVYFDKNGRPVSIVMTSKGYSLLGLGWSFVYKNRGWEYIPDEDWHKKLFSDKYESLDPYAPRFLIKDVEKKKEVDKCITHDEL